MENKGIESIIIENNDFDIWCDIVGKDIVSETFLNKDNISFKIKTHILNNENFFYSCLKTNIETKIERLKKKMRLGNLNDRKSYLELGLELSELNARLKKYNIERTKAFQRNDYVIFKKFLREKGHEQLIIEFNNIRTRH